MQSSWRISRHGGLASGLSGGPAPLLLVLLSVGLCALLIGKAVMARQCTSLPTLTGEVETFLAKGQPDLAIGLVANALAQGQPPLCAPTQRTLAQLWYSASLDALLATPAGDPTTDAQLPLRWLAIEQQATAYDVPTAERRTASSLAIDAQGRGLWALARAAFLQAFRAGEVGVDAVPRYYAILRNGGHALAFVGSAKATDDQRLAQGVHLLATAQAVASAYHLPNGEACLDLQALGYADCSTAAPDSQDPVLMAAAHDQKSKGGA